MNKKIFIDGGTHFFEGLQQFLKIYNIDTNWEVVTFEGSPDICKSPQYKKNLKKLQNKTHITPLNKCLGDNNKICEFMIPQQNIYNVIGCIDNYHQFNLDTCKIYKVEEISLSDYIKNNFNKEDYIICKLDIEGAEYKVVKNLIDTNIIEYINDIYVEWHHDNQWGHKFPKTYSVEDQQKYLHAKQQLIQLSKEGKIKYTEWY